MGTATMRWPIPSRSTRTTTALSRLDPVRRLVSLAAVVSAGAFRVRGSVAGAGRGTRAVSSVAARTAASSSLSGANGVGSSLRSTAAYTPYVGCACSALRFAHALPSPRSVLARKKRKRPPASHIGDTASASASVMGVTRFVSTDQSAIRWKWLGYSRA